MLTDLRFAVRSLSRSPGFSAVIVATLAAYSYGSVVLTGVDEPQQIGRVQVSPSLFDVLGVQPALGRAFQAAEHAEPARSNPLAESPSRPESRGPPSRRP